MNNQAKIFIAVIALGGLVGVVYGLANVPGGEDLGVIVILGVLCALAQVLAVPLFSNSSVSLSYAIAFVSLLLFGPAAAILANLGSALVHAFYPVRRKWYKAIFNAGVVIISAAAAGVTFYLAGGMWPAEDLVGNAAPAAAAAIVYYLVNTATVSYVVALTTGSSLAAVFNRSHRWLIFHYLTIAGLALIVAPAYKQLGVPGLLLFSLPFLMPWASLRAYVEQARAALVSQL